MDSFEKAYNLALRFLSYRPRSEKEVRNYLKLKDQSASRRTKLATVETKALIEKVIQKLKDQNFINDSEFAKTWMESRIRFKPKSFSLIKLELKQKGISQELIDNLKFRVDDLKNAGKLAEKKFERFKNLPEEEIYQKFGRYLASKGFDWDTIKKTIDDLLSKRV